MDGGFSLRFCTTIRKYNIFQTTKLLEYLVNKEFDTEKENKTEDELHLLMELQSLSKVIDTIGFSLHMSGDVCKTCGRPL